MPTAPGRWRRIESKQADWNGQAPNTEAAQLGLHDAWIRGACPQPSGLPASHSNPWLACYSPCSPTWGSLERSLHWECHIPSEAFGIPSTLQCPQFPLCVRQLLGCMMSMGSSNSMGEVFV
jgi:hypothetical protein